MSSEGVVVAVRVRPTALDEDPVLCIANNSIDVTQIAAVSADGSRRRLSSKQSKQTAGRRTFTFDRCFGPEATQEEVFDALGRPALGSCTAGYNATIFAYGQTGSGKTFSILGEGADDGGPGEDLDPLDGIVPRFFKELLSMLHSDDSITQSYDTRVS